MNVLFCCVASGVPPVDTVYHLYCPADPPDAVNVMDVPEQPDPPVVTGAEGVVRMDAVTAVRLLSQPLLFNAT